MNLRYVTSIHPLQQLKRWTNRLSAFRFCAAYGGHANDGNSFIARYKGTPEQLSQFATAVGTDIEKNQIVEMHGHKPFMSFFDEILQIEMRSVDNAYEVDNATVDAAEKIEKICDEFSLQAILPPRDNAYCFCKKYYPEQFTQ